MTTHDAPWGVFPGEQARQVLVAGLYWVQLGSMGLHQQLTSANPVLHQVQQLLEYQLQLGSMPSDGMMHCPTWNAYPCPQLRQFPLFGSQLSQRRFTSAQAPLLTQQPLMQATQLLPTTCEQQGMLTAAATMQVLAERVQPGQQERQLPLVRSLSLQSVFKAAQMPEGGRQYPLEQAMQFAPWTLMQQGSLLRLAACADSTHWAPDSEQPSQQEAQALRAAVKVLQRGSVFWQFMPGVRKYPEQQPVQTPFWFVPLQLGSVLVVEEELRVQLPARTLQPGQQERQLPLDWSEVLQRGLFCLHLPVESRKYPLQHFWQAALLKFWQLRSLLLAPPTEQVTPESTYPGQQERQAPVLPSEVLQRGLTCLHLPEASMKKREEQVAQIPFEESIFWQLGSGKETVQQPALRLQPGQQLRQVPSARLDVLQRGFSPWQKDCAWLQQYPVQHWMQTPPCEQDLQKGSVCLLTMQLRPASEQPGQQERQAPLELQLLQRGFTGTQRLLDPQQYRFEHWAQRLPSYFAQLGSRLPITQPPPYEVEPPDITMEPPFEEEGVGIQREALRVYPAMHSTQRPVRRLQLWQKGVEGALVCTQAPLLRVKPELQVRQLPGRAWSGVWQLAMRMTTHWLLEIWQPKTHWVQMRPDWAAQKGMVIVVEVVEVVVVVTVVSDCEETHAPLLS